MNKNKVSLIIVTLVFALGIWFASYIIPEKLRISENEKNESFELINYLENFNQNYWVYPYNNNKKNSLIPNYPKECLLINNMEDLDKCLLITFNVKYKPLTSYWINNFKYSSNWERFELTVWEKVLYSNY